MRKRLARLFTIKTRFEVWLVIFAIATGAVERGRHYLEIYPGTLGWVFALLCTGVVFLAGGKLLDSVTPQPAVVPGPYAGQSRRRMPISRSRSRARPMRTGSGSPISLHKD